MKKIFATIFFAITGIIASPAQGLLGSLFFDTWVDNREYNIDGGTILPGTSTGVRIAPELGFAWRKEHSIMVGIDLQKDFGTETTDLQTEPIVYYNYLSGGLKGYAGIFPRTLWRDGYSSAFLTGGKRHYEAYISGVLVHYGGENGYIEALLDWRSNATATQREKIMAFSSGSFHFNKLVSVAYFMSMNHLGHVRGGHGASQNIQINPYVRFDLMQRGVREGNIYISAGMLQTFQRDYQQENENPGGFTADMQASKWGLSLRNTVYAGKGLMPYYNTYGADLYYGDPFYRTDKGVYNRLALSWQPFYGDRTIDLLVRGVCHYDGHGWGWQQLVSVTIKLDKSTIK